MQSFSLTCHLYPKLLSCVFQTGPSICPSPGCLSSASCPGWALMPSSVSRPFVSLLFRVCQAKGAGLIFLLKSQTASFHPPSSTHQVLDCEETWLLPGFFLQLCLEQWDTPNTAPNPFSPWAVNLQNCCQSLPNPQPSSSL